jgi:hypothetical protein
MIRLRKSGGRRREITGLVVVALAALGLVATSVPASATVSGDAGFEFADGNLAHNSAMDWNDFAPTTWTGTAPSRTATKLSNGWAFTGLEDAQKANSDSAFAGGTKQDKDCASVIGASAPNKDDLKRVYVTSKTVNGDVFLGLAWVRIPQQTTSSSAHIGFEFNQGTTACPAGSDGLVRRTAGDMLIVYDFEGGGGTPVISLRRWLTDPNDPAQAGYFTDPNSPCDVDSNSVPCWGDAKNLTSLGFAEAAVNTGTTVTDLNTPPTSGTQSVSSSLGDSEFGEAGINLTDAGVFTPGVCTGFGKTYAVSRSSGNSGTAQMKDLVGPGNISIANCGAVVIRKVTVPSPDATNTTFNYTTTGTLNPATFALKNGEARDYGTSVQAGSYSVTESDPGPNFTFTNLDCSASETSDGTTINISGATVSFSLAANDKVDCTYTNTLKTGAIKVTKTRKHAADGPGDHPHAGVNFTVGGVTKATDASGVACFDGLTFGSYTVHETVPAGYQVDGNDKQVTVDNVATCSDNPYGGETVSFHNTPLTDLSVTVNSQVDGGTASTVDCTPDGPSGSTGANGDGTFSDTNLPPGTYTCTVVIDP